MTRQPFDFRHFAAGVGQPTGLAGRLLGASAAIAAAILAFMFSLIAVTLVVAGGAALGGWLWWKTREARKGMNGRRPAGGYVIEGEAVRERDPVAAGRLPR